MKADAAWQALEAKVAGTDVEYKDVRVTPLIAVTLVEALPRGAEGACLLPAEVRAGGGGGRGCGCPAGAGVAR